RPTLEPKVSGAVAAGRGARAGPSRWAGRTGCAVGGSATSHARALAGLGRPSPAPALRRLARLGDDRHPRIALQLICTGGICLGSFRLERKLVGVERARNLLHRPWRTRISGAAVPLRPGDCLLV